MKQALPAVLACRVAYVHLAVVAVGHQAEGGAGEGRPAVMAAEGLPSEMEARE